MITPLLLEQPGRWRITGLILFVLLLVLPVTPLLKQLFTSAGVTLAFGNALTNSLLVAFTVGIIALGLGLPAGVLAACYQFRGKYLLLAGATLPLLVPSILWAIGWAVLQVKLTSGGVVMPPMLGCVLVFTSIAFPLVLITAYLSCCSLSASQIDAARLAGGEGLVVQLALRHALIPAAIAAGLGGVLTLSDAGPAQIFGLRTAATDILTSFSARYDFALAAAQSITLAMVTLIVATPLAIIGGSRMACSMLARQVQPMRAIRLRGMGAITRLVLLLFVLIAVVAPVMGLLTPLFKDSAFLRAWSEFERTASDTVIYAMGAAGVAVILGFLLAFFVGRQQRLRTVALAVMLMVFALPPAMTSLGLVYLGTEAPAWADLLLRSRLTVCIALGLRFLPVAAMIALWVWGSSSPSWALVAGVHGVSIQTYLRRILLPFVLPAGLLSVLLVALLASADIGTVLLLHPPGAGSLPLAIFTIMANAPESLVASLCLIYLAIAALLVVGVWAIAGRQRS
jgi:iron(III) transport system permease protein